MTSSIIRIGASGGGSFGAHLSIPATGRGAGVLLLHEIVGVNNGLLETADELADHGYFALVPDLFWRLRGAGAPPEQTAEAGMQMLQSFDWTLAIADLNACVASLRVVEGCTGKVGSVGYCLGGRLAFMMALSSDADCDVSFHGVGIEQLVDGAVGLRHPVQIHMGEADHIVPPDAQKKIRDKLSGHALAEVFSYAGAKHGFARPLSRNFDPAAYQSGMTRMYAFFRKHLS